MHVEDVARPGPLVQVVDVLGDDQQVAPSASSSRASARWAGLGLDPGERGAALVVEPVDQVGVGGVRLGRRDQHRVVALPQPVGVPERRQPALGGDAGTGEDDDPHVQASLHHLLVDLDVEVDLLAVDARDR